MSYNRKSYKSPAPCCPHFLTSDHQALRNTYCGEPLRFSDHMVRLGRLRKSNLNRRACVLVACNLQGQSLDMHIHEIQFCTMSRTGAESGWVTVVNVYGHRGLVASAHSIDTSRPAIKWSLPEVKRVEGHGVSVIL